MKKTIFILGLIFLTGLFYFCYNAYNRADKNIKDIPVDLKVSSSFLITEFVLDTKKAESLYSNKLLQISGKVKEITFLNNRNTLILQGQTEFESILCEIQITEEEKLKKLKKDQEVILKGICKGFLKDVIVLNCLLVDE